MGGRALPTYCDDCGEIDDWGDFGPDDWDGESECVCPLVRSRMVPLTEVFRKGKSYVHDGVQAGVSTYAGCALSDVVTIFSNKPGDTAILVAAITVVLRLTANARQAA